MELKEIYEKYSDFVYNLSLKLLCDSDDAEDVVQEVFIKVHRNLNSFRGDAKIKTWLYKITVNTSINILRKRKSQNNLYKKAKNKLKITLNLEEAESLEDKVIEGMEADKIYDKIFSQLPEHYRTCIILKNIEGLSYKEICSILNISQNTLKTRLLRGKKKLLEFINKEKGVNQ